MDTQKFPPCPYCGSTEMRTGFQTYEATVKKQRGSMMGGSALQQLGRRRLVAADHGVAAQQRSRIARQALIEAVGKKAHRRQRRHGQHHRQCQQAQLAGAKVAQRLAPGQRGDGRG